MPLIETTGNVTADAYGGGVAAKANYIEDVFSTWLYTGNGSTQTITNGIDLAGKGGAVFTRCRSNAETNQPTYDTARGVGNWVATYSTAAQTFSSGGLTSFNADGFTIGSSFQTGGRTYVSWTFRKQPKFFDVVTYTGTGSPQTIAHNLGSVPGCIITKCTSTTGNWITYHRSLGSTDYVNLNTTVATTADSGAWNNTNPTSTNFTVGSGNTNNSGTTYVAYLFAHNAGGFGLTGTDNVISCGSFTTNASGDFSVNLGYEPQFMLVKTVGIAQNWDMRDSMRGWSYSQGMALYPNTSGAESDEGGVPSSYWVPTATGSEGKAYFSASQTYIYIAIRRGPMKVPTDATKVFAPIAANNSVGTINTTGFPIDLQIACWRDGISNKVVDDRLRGVSTTTAESGQLLTTNTTGSESVGTITRAWNNTGFQTSSGGYDGLSAIYWNFRRAPSFFDEVCYTGTGGTQTLNHNLGVAPELAIVKTRSTTSNWAVAQYSANVGLYLDSNIAAYGNASSSSIRVPTATTINVANTICNATAQTFVMYLFATCPGVSKVGSYTGNGTTQTINCGFAGGARFVLIKRTDSTGDWYVWDTARGIISGNDPYLLMNSTAAEVTTTDYISPQSSGFGLTASAPAALNASGGTYIFLAIA